MSAATLDRQLELTANALCRSVRRTLRAAERENPTGTSGIWKAVEHRCTLLRQFLGAAKGFMKPEANSAPAPNPAGSPKPASPMRGQGAPANPPLAEAQPAEQSSPGLTRERISEILGMPLEQVKFYPYTPDAASG